MNAFMNAATWLEGVMTGPGATAIAILAVAAIGLGALRGRIDIMRAGKAVLGCFLIFGAATLARGISSEIRAEGVASPPTSELPRASPPIVPEVAKQPYDPYAGAALPNR